MNSSATLTGCDDIIKRLREAIAARPTPGPWKIRAERYKFIHVYATGGGICHLDTVDGEGAANAKLIAAASPDNIAALLDRLDAAEAENERLRAENDALAADARRYRWLRRKFAIIPTARSASAFVPVNLPQPTHIAPDAAVELDAAIDAARAAEEKKE